MLYALICIDKPDSGALRADTRQKHLDYLESFRDKIAIAGPVMSSDGATPKGSLLILEFKDAKEVQDFVRGDPYGQAGVFASVTAAPFKKVLP